MRFFFVILLLASVGIHSFDDDWGDIQDIEFSNQQVNATKSVENYWDEHIYGSISGAVSVGNNHQRFSSEVKLGFSEHWKDFKIVLEGAHRQSTIETAVNIIDNYSGELMYEDEVTLRSEYLEIRQAYVEYYPIDNFLFSAGKQTQVWGQLDIFSPVDFLLPMDFNPTGFSLIKADNRMPQTTVKVAYYPVNQIEITGYYFPYFEESPLFDTVDFSSNYTSIDDIDYYWEKIVPSEDSEAARAVRMMWYSSLFTAGVTYYDGFNINYPVFKSKIMDTGSNDNYSTTTEYGYYPKKAVGFEMNVPFGNINLKADAALSDDYIWVDLGTSDLRTIVNNYNDGYDAIPAYMGFYAVGIDADFDHWFCNFYLMSIQYYQKSSMDDFWDEYNVAYRSVYKEDFQLSDIPLFPTLNIGRYFSEEKKGGYGFALGYFTGSLGAVIYMSNQINESLSWGASLDAIGSFSDIAMLAQVSRSDDSEGEYSDYQFVEPKITFGLGYLL